MSLIKIIEKTEAPEDTHWLSPSQLEAYISCPCCWYKQYVLGIKSEQGYWARLGTKVHTILEEYLKTGNLDVEEIWGKKARVPVGRIAQSGVKYLPPRENVIGTEDWLYLTLDGIYFRGKYDFIFKDDTGYSIADHKTKTKLDRALTIDGLAKDVQANIYSAFIQTKFNIESNKLHWIYYLTVGQPDAKLVQTTVTREQVEQNIKNIVELSRKLLHAKDNGPLELVPPKDGCKSFKEKDQICYYEEMRMGRDLKDLLNNKPAPVVSANQVPETTAKSVGFTLFVDCMPRKGYDKVIEFSEILQGVFGMIADEKNVSHHTFIQFEARGVFVTTLDKYLSKNPIADGTAVIMTLTPDARDALDIMMLHASQVVQAVSR